MSGKSIKKSLFKTAKRLLPNKTVAAIQRQRLEGTKIKRSAPGSYTPSITYTVVSAVYNAEPYLDDFFESLMHQTIDPTALKVIMVDDGSTDASAEIIHSWQERFPGRIQYVNKENGGQASARNLGLTMVNTEWVTFIDPDDFVTFNYFEQVDKTIAKHSTLEMVSCPLVFYREEEDIFQNTHPLRFRFGSKDRVYNIQDDCHPIQLSMATAFFKVASIRRQGLVINEDIKPNFEDGDFVNRYLLGLNKGTICFASKPKYFYRKRLDGTSTLDVSWQGSGRLTVVTKTGYLLLLLYAREKKGYVPQYIQETVLYELSWYFKNYVGIPKRCEKFLKNDTAEHFLSILDNIFDNIDAKCIESAKGAWLRYEWKYALMTQYKNAYPSSHIAYVETIRPNQKAFLVRTCDPSMKLFLEGEELSPFNEKKCSVPFFGKQYQALWLRWYAYEDENQMLSYCTDWTVCTKLTVRGKQFRNRAPIGELVRKFTEKWSEYPKKGKTWLVMDRDTQADDNGEHFYRWMMINHPEQSCVFALRKTSPHWNRLKAEGFHLVDYGTEEHERALKQCSKIISSHADKYVHSYFDDNFYRSKDFVFLQHGVTKDDLSSWLNGKPISLFITATPQEYNSIICSGSSYRFTSKQVVLSGFCRHDNLLKLFRNNTSKERKLLIAPTWREFLLGKTKDKGNERDLNEDFADSQYAKEWNSVLSDPKLKALADEYNCKIVFFPHANILPYVEQGCFSIPEYVELGTCENKSIQYYLSSASLCVTDYSSVAFDVAYLGVPCVYYQFDREEMFQGGHIGAKGYFDYRKDGFGPVVTAKNELIDILFDIAENDFNPPQVYRRRMDETFIFHDGKCCERVYDAIKKLDKPL